MTQPIDTAYVDIVARDKSLDKMRRDIDRKMDQVERDINGHLKDIDQGFDDTFAEIDKHFAALEKTAADTVSSIDDDFEVAFDSITKQVTITRRNVKASFDGMADDSDSTFRRMRSRFITPLSNGLEHIGDTIKSVGSTIGSLGSSLGGAVTSFPMLVLILALAPAVISLVAALSQLIGLVALLPSSLGILLAAILPLVLAFQNFGDAVSAVASGDLEKMDEALKKLSPSAAFVAREIGRMLPLLRDFQKSLQEAFFSKIIFDMTHFAMIVLPMLTRAMGAVAGAFGQLLHEFAVWMRTADNLIEFQSLFQATARIIEQLTAPFIRFADALLRVTVHALPFVEKLSQGFGNLLDRFSLFLTRSVNDGSFDQFLQDGLDTLKELIDLLKASGGLISTIFSGTEDAGHDFIKSLTTMIQKLDEFFQTADGKFAIDALILATKALGFAILATLTLFASSVQVLRQILQFFNDVGVGATNFVDKTIDKLKQLREAVITYIKNIPETIGNLLQLAWDQLLIRIGNGLGIIIFMFTQFPQQVVDAVQNLPERLWQTFTNVALRMGEALSTGMSNAKQIVIDGVNSIVSFITSVPDRLKSLLPQFGGAGSNLIEAFMNGLRRVGNFVGDVAGDVVGAIKGFLNKAIDRINVGIKQVDDVLPGSLPRLPRLAEGALVRKRPGGTAAIIGEGNEDEVVVPLSKLNDVGGGGSITFGPGAINVNYSGVVPTESEARTTGAAIGRGILDILSRQNARVQVRAV